MNRTQRAKIKAAHESLEMAREFKNDALTHGDYERLSSEKKWFTAKRLELRSMKKYTGPVGMTESFYKEFVGA